MELILNSGNFMLWHGDNMELLKSTPDKHYDLIIADPPYFSGPEKRLFYGSKSPRLIKGKDYPISERWEVPGIYFFNEIFRCSKNQIIWGENYYGCIWPKPGRIIWDKCNGQDSNDV